MAPNPVKFLGKIFEVPHTPTESGEYNITSTENTGVRQLLPTYQVPKAEALQSWNLPTPFMAAHD